MTPRRDVDRNSSRTVLFGVLAFILMSWFGAAVAVWQLYEVGFTQAERLLSETAQNEVAIIEALYEHELQRELGDEAARASVLDILTRANAVFTGFGETGEFTLGQRRGDEAQFLLERRHHADTRRIDVHVPLKDAPAEPMRRALKGEVGTLVGLDYREEQVLAAYVGSERLGWGLVAKIDRAEVRAPYLRVAAIALVVTGLYTIILAFFAYRIYLPSIRRVTESERRLQAVTENMVDGLITLNSTGEVVSFNRAAERLFGYRAAQVVGEQVTVLLPERYRQDHARAFAKRVDDKPKRPLRLKANVHGLKRDGTEFPLRLSVGEAKVGEEVCFVGVAHDMTAANRAQEALVESEKRLLLTLSSVSDGAWDRDLRTDVVHFSDEYLKTMGYARGEIQAHFEFWKSTVHEDDRARTLAALEAHIRGETEAYESVYRTKPKAGDYRWFQSMGRVVERDRAGRPIRIVGAIRDVTERHKLQVDLEERAEALKELNERLKANHAQLIQSEKMAAIGQLAAGVAHEINNPVGYVKSNLNTLQDYVTTFKALFDAHAELAAARRADEVGRAQELEQRITKLEAEEDLEFILEDSGGLISESQQGIERVREIVASLKSFARKDETRKELADVNAGLEATLKVVWNELKYHCEVDKQLGDLPDVRCNLGQLNQVFMNLLVNAAQAIPEQGHITIRTEVDLDDVVIKISDTGVGIPPEDLERIFNPFYTTKEVGKGTGLGLSISHGIIIDHGGTIEAESLVGEGTTFTIRLPSVTE